MAGKLTWLFPSVKKKPKKEETASSPEVKKAESAETNEEEGRQKTGGQNKGKKPARRKKKSLAEAILALVIKVAIIAVVVVLLVTVVGGVFICHTSDMYPSLRDGDLVITFRLGGYRSGDIVAYRYDGETYFGRIIGEPGDEVIIDKEGNFTVNGLAPYEMIFYETKARDSDSMKFPYIVQEGEYFILADEREQALDSRNFGPVEQLMGKVVLVIRRRGF